MSPKYFDTEPPKNEKLHLGGNQTIISIFSSLELIGYELYDIGLGTLDKKTQLLSGEGDRAQIYHGEHIDTLSFVEDNKKIMLMRSCPTDGNRLLANKVKNR